MPAKCARREAPLGRFAQAPRRAVVTCLSPAVGLVTFNICPPPDFHYFILYAFSSLSMLQSLSTTFTFVLPADLFLALLIKKINKIIILILPRLSRTWNMEHETEYTDLPKE